MKIIQLSENIEYPQGFNAITIEGYDDSANSSFKVRLWPKVTLVVEPKSISSDGLMRATCTATIEDPDPDAYYASLHEEHASAENPTTINTQYYIQAISGIWYYLGEVDGEPILGDPIEYLSFEGNVIITKDELVYQDVWVEYTGNDTVSFSASGVSGEIAPQEVMLNGKTAIAFFTPEQGEGGLATITARWKNSEASAILEVRSGLLDDYSISLSCGGSVPVGGTLGLSVSVTDKNEAPIVGDTIKFFSLSAGGEGGGYCTPDEATLSEEDIVEERISNDRSTINTSKSIITLNDITAPGYTYTGATWRGNTILLNSELPYEQTPVTADYSSGGSASFTFHATRVGKVFIFASYKNANDVCEVEVTPGAGLERQITMEVDPSSIAVNSCSCLRVTVVDGDNNPMTGDVSFGILTGNGSLLKTVASLGPKYREEWQDASSLTEVSVDYPIKDIVDITFNGTSYLTGATFVGDTITFSTPLPGLVPLFIKYNATGYAENKFFAPSGVGVTIINATFVDETGTYIDTGKIDITIPGTGGGGGDDEPGGDVQPVYDTRVVSRAIGFLNPYDHIEDIQGVNCSASFDSWGAGSYCDAWGGVDNDPSGDPIVVALVPAAFGFAVVEYTVSGGQLLSKPNTFYSTLPIAVDWSYTLNSRFMRLRVTERPTEPDVDGIPIGDASWVLGGETRTTDAEGVTTFSKLPAGTYPTSITHPNYKTNTEDSDTDNDTVIVEETTNKKYKLSVTNIDITVTAKFISGWNIINPPETPEGEEEEEEETRPCCEG